MSDTAYDLPVFRDGIWFPTRNTRIRGRLVSVVGVAYEFAPERPIPHLRLSVPAVTDGFLAAPDDDGVYHKLDATTIIEVHCFPERLLKELEAVRPREGEDVEISTGPELVRGFLTYVVSAGGRWSTAEHWAPEDISTYCAFGTAHLHAPEAPGERTGVFQPVTKRAKDSTSARDALENATDLLPPKWPALPSGAKLFTPETGR